MAWILAAPPDGEIESSYLAVQMLFIPCVATIVVVRLERDSCRMSGGERRGVQSHYGQRP